MIDWFKKYWREILVFGLIFGILLLDAAPSMTWINTDSDGVHYVYAAKNMFLSHKTSAPLFLLLGHAFLLMPFGIEFWRMVLISVFATTIASIFVYLIIIQLVNKRWLALLGTVIYGSSALVMSQSTIVETYALVSMFCVGAYYFAIRSKWATSAFMLGLGLAVHHLIGIAIVPLLVANKELRSPKRLLIIASGLLFYLYIPISVHIFHSPDMWGNSSVRSFFGDNLSTMTMLVGGLSIWDLPKRLLDAIGLFGVSFGVGSILIVWYLIKEHRLFRNQLFWLFILPIAYYIVDLAPQTNVYVMPSIAFGSVIIAIQLNKVRHIWSYATAIVAIGIFAFNANYFDIGRTLDKNLSATKFYNEQLSKIPDGQILMAQYGWEWAMIFPYDKNESRNIIPIDIDTLVSPEYQKQLSSQGIKFSDNFDIDIAKRQAFIASSIVSLNDNVWTTVSTVPSSYGSKVVRAKDYPELVNRLPTEPPAQIHWKPSNVYGSITGSIEISEWKYITYSNKNMRFFLLIIIYAIIPYLIILRMIDKRKISESKT